MQNFKGVFDHNRKRLTEKFDGGGKLINVMQFQRVIEVLLISEGGTYNFKEKIAYLLLKYTPPFQNTCLFWRNCCNQEAK